jgi:hypothetical protein
VPTSLENALGSPPALSIESAASMGDLRACLPYNMRMRWFFLTFRTRRRNVGTPEAVARERGFGKTRNLPLT